MPAQSNVRPQKLRFYGTTTRYGQEHKENKKHFEGPRNYIMLEPNFFFYFLDKQPRWFQLKSYLYVSRFFYDPS